MNRLNNDRKQPDWESLEFYEGEKIKELRPWQANVLGVFFALIGLGFVFVICGSALWFVVYRYGGWISSSKVGFALNEEAWMAWTRFIVGGAIGVFFTIRWWCKIKIG